MLAPDFYGRKPLVWWVGVVEDRKDPLFMGQLRVRIFGLHPKDKNILPTEKLPWAIVLQPTTATKTACVPREGDWVMGYFKDGEAGQSPVITGVFSGVDTVQANVAGKEYTPPPNNWGFFDPRTKGEVEEGPRPPDWVEDRKKNEPSLYRRLSYGELEGTGVKHTNENLSHACDITMFVKASACGANFYFSKVAQTVRTTINALLAALGVDATGITSFFTSELKRILAIFKQIQSFIQDVNRVLQCVNEVINVVNSLVQFAATLPARLVGMAQACLSQIISQIYSALTSFISNLIPGEIREVAAIVGTIARETVNTYNMVQNTIATAQGVVVNGTNTLNNIENFSENLSKNTESAVNGLTTSITRQIENNNKTAVTAVGTNTFSITREDLENAKRIVN